MTWVKICGLRDPKDLAVAEDAGADAVGFLLAPSPRRVGLAEATDLVAAARAMSVLVTADLTPEAAVDLLDKTGADALQVHGAHRVEAAAAARAFGKVVLFSISVMDGVDWKGIPADVIPLLDAPEPGSGRVFDWNLIGNTRRRFALAGGLDPDNVAAAVARTGAWGVDVSSGVESSPGRKDPTLIRRFVERAKQS